MKKTEFQQYVEKSYHEKDKLWFFIWITFIGFLWIWNKIFLNQPAFSQIQTGFINTIMISIAVIIISLIFAWMTGLGLYYLKNLKLKIPFLFITFLVNLLRSIPQIIGILLGYILINSMLLNELISGHLIIVFMMALTLSLFVFLDISELIMERIDYFKNSDFFPAMLSLGIKESRIINFEILWKNSLVHLINKMISVFGMTIFLLCSVDFIISVGLSKEVSSVNLPVTLGSLLTKIDSKQDILAIGHSIFDISYFPKIFFEHLQGVTVATLIVFTLICIFKISNGFTKRYHL